MEFGTHTLLYAMPVAKKNYISVKLSGPTCGDFSPGGNDQIKWNTTGDGGFNICYFHPETWQKGNDPISSNQQICYFHP